ncbi:hypothetical protein A3J41_01445 [candidate division TM6 bacterium RIFCSPHIGHO2_12_FULL_38_8]|nr:MAG: hypothetical protein A3J41_01445 [candidate division TM6 bacterium RIFCSPHIGHO2_12_FULL_38_8]
MAKKQMFVTRLADALVKLQVFSADEAENLVKEFTGRAKGRIDDFLLDEGLVDRETLLKVLQAVYALPPFDVRGHFFNHQLLLFFPKDFLTNQGFIPLDVDDEIMTIVMSNPEDEETLDTLSRYVSYNVNVFVGIRRDIVDAIEEYYDEDVVTSDIEEQEKDIDDDGMQDSDIVDIL